MTGSTAVTEAELVVLLSFLTGGSLAGIVGHWLDELVALVRGR